MTHLRRSYPLGALFVLVTACAVLAVGVAPLAAAMNAGRQDVGQLVFALGSGAICGLTIGMIIGLLQFRVAVGLGIGALAGVLIGAVGGALALLPVSALAGAAGAMTGGSALIVGVALIMRKGND